MKTLAAVLLCVLVGACASAVPTPTRTIVPTPNPSPSSAIAFVCPPIYCSDDSKGAVLKAVAGLAYPVKTVTIGLFGLSCGEPFPSRTASCPLATDPLPTAYVTFVGTDRVAAVEIGTVIGGRGVDRLVAFEIPPAGWSLPRP